MKKKKKLDLGPKYIKKLIDAGIADAKAGRITTYDKNATTKVEVSFPLCLRFFNDTGKPIVIRTTPWTHANNPETIQPLSEGKIYIQQGFLKLWDRGEYFQLLVE